MPPGFRLLSTPTTCHIRTVPIPTQSTVARKNERSFSQSSIWLERKSRRTRFGIPVDSDEFSREQAMFMTWLNTEAINFRDPTGKPNYIGPRKHKKEDGADGEQAASTETSESDPKGDKNSKKQANLRPFPLNPYFKSMPVLSENLKEEIYQRVVKQSQTIRATSQQFKVSMERVAAVVRMKQMERDRIAKRLPIVPFYTEKIMEMLPQTHYQKNKPVVSHESINDLPVHPATTRQIFWPSAESREFTRIDAGKVFKSDLLPADLRMPHPQIVEKWANELRLRRSDALRRMQVELEDKMSKEAEEKARAEEENNSVVKGQRWDFKFEKVNADWVGKDGRNRKGIGWRYGMPHEDRKRGQIKIPTKVE